ncbi:hypothetical protein [Rhodococcus sp. Leaf233]|uniref:hypothetical protein n=1 Tax=Rhodococcus sp. Leaf233 TaxID=1736302 RepID=UPI00070DBCDC|nr:hypothetical protein [Rhodococcus sp. Leaf233]KQU33552.1 hypothetical protein ASH04_06875 [Rhodococcus sp. Leaf233]
MKTISTYTGFGMHSHEYVNGEEWTSSVDAGDGSGPHRHRVVGGNAYTASARLEGGMMHNHQLPVFAEVAQ